MLAMLLATMMALPLYPINPVRQDTVNFMNLHFSVGVNAPNGILGPGTELTSKYELLVSHPFVIRGTFDYRAAKMMATRYPEGVVYGPSLSLEALYYRGTNKLTGFIGLAALVTFYDMSTSSSATDSLKINHDIDDIDLTSALGYRLTVGLRFSSLYVLELSISEVRPSLIYRRSFGENSYAERYEKIRFNDFRLSFGYIMPLLN